MKAKKILPMFLITVFIAGSNVIAYDKECDSKCDSDKMRQAQEERFDKISKELNLTEKQQEQVKNHRKKHREQMKETAVKTKEIREAMRKELEKPEIDKAKINKLSSELKELEAKRIDNRTKGIIEMREILTPEQYQKMNQMTEKKRERIKKQNKNIRQFNKGKMQKGRK